MLVNALVIAVAVLAIGFVVIVARRPPEVRVVRSVSIAAPAAVVFAQVNDLRNWAAWSAWANIDPAMQRSYTGAAAGTGAVYAWSGNRAAGRGRLTIVESRPSELVRMKLEMYSLPAAAAADSAFTFTPRGD